MNPRPGQYSEDQLVEQPAIRLFEELGWGHVNAYRETLGPQGTLGRDNMAEVFLIRRLRAAIERLNPGMPSEAIEQAVTEITKPRTAMHYARANEQVHTLLRDRVEVSVRQPDGTALPERLVVIDWDWEKHRRTTTSCSSPSSGCTPTCTASAPT